MLDKNGQLPRDLHIEWWPMIEVSAYKGNPRKNEGAIADVRDSLLNFGWEQPCVVDGEGVLIVGHTRYYAALDLKQTHLPVYPARHLSPARARAYRLADNKTGERAEWDLPLLALELRDLQALGVDLQLTGFRPPELEQLMLPDGGAKSGSDPDDVPSIPKKATTKLGDVIYLGQHRLLCGDCRDFAQVERLVEGSEVNLVVTSPPYASQRKYDADSGFKPIPPAEYVEWYGDVARNLMAVLAADGSYCCNIKEHCENGQRHLYVTDLLIAHVREWGWRWVDTFCWKRGGVPGKWPNRFKNQWEPIYHYSRQEKIKLLHSAVTHPSENVFTYSRDNQKSKTGFITTRGTTIVKDGMALPGNLLDIGVETGLTEEHSAPFPVALPTFFLNAMTEPGDRVLDPFAGSGTTLIAAEMLHRQCLAIEISPLYCDVIVARWEKLTGQKARRPR